jgi:hypothetical protein
MKVVVPLWAAVTALVVVCAGVAVVVTLLLSGGDGGDSSTNFEPWPEPIESAFFRDCGTADGCKCIFEQLQLRIPADEAVAAFKASGLEKFLLRDYRSENIEAVETCLDL